MKKILSQFSQKLFSLLIISAVILLQAPLALAAPSCGSLNNQTSPDLKDKILVITEEPLGSASGAGNTTDGGNSAFRCARKTVCTPAPASDAPAGAGNPAKQKRICNVSYENVNNCEPTSSTEMQKIMSGQDTTGAEYIICEMVQVYVADGGTNLLYFYIGQIYRYFAWFGGILAVLIMIVAGFMQATAGDNTEQVNKAKTLLARCITGLVVLFLSAAILYIVNPNFFVI